VIFYNFNAESVIKINYSCSNSLTNDDLVVRFDINVGNSNFIKIIYIPRVNSLVYR